MCGVVSVITDCITFAMPFPIIISLQLSPKKRLGLLIVFFIAFWYVINFLVESFADFRSTVVASCASLAYRVLVYKGVTDATWVAMRVIITS